MNTLSKLQLATIAHTDAGDYLQIDGKLQKEFLVKGQIVKERAGLFFLEIEGVKFTTHKIEGFSVGETVNCILRFMVRGKEKVFQIRSLEKITK